MYNRKAIDLFIRLETAQFLKLNISSTEQIMECEISAKKIESIFVRVLRKLLMFKKGAGV